MLCQVSFSAVCLKMSQDKTLHTNKMPLNNTGAECPHKDPEISGIPNHQTYGNAGDRVTGRGKMFALAVHLSERADHKAALSVMFTDP